MVQRIWPKRSLPDLKNGRLEVDTHGTSDGYVLVAVRSVGEKATKIQIEKDGEVLGYNLNRKGMCEIFPLQMGNGRYKITLYEKVTGRQYKSIGSVSFDVKMRNPESPFLVPNKYVSYKENSLLVKTADKLCKGMDEKDAYHTICNYMKYKFMYDYVKALTVKAGEIPDIEGAMKKRMGICQDLAAIAVAMFRSQGIPAKLVIGYADKQYHAWTTCMINGKEMLYDPTVELSAMRKVKTYTPERVY